MKPESCRRGPFPPADPMIRHALERDPEPDYDALALESGIVSCVVGEHPVSGVDVAELTRDLEVNPRFREVPRRAIEGAIQRLSDRGLLRVEREVVRPGPVFGSAVTTDMGPSVN